MGPTIVPFDAQTTLIGGVLILIGIVLVGFAMVTLFLAWRAARRNYSRTRAETAALHQEQEAERAAHANALDTKQAELAALHSQFNATQEELHRTQTDLDASNQRATHLQEHQQILERDLQEQQNQVAAATHTIADHKLEIADLTNQLGEAETQREQIAALEALLQTTRGTVASLSDELAHTQEQAARVTTLEAEAQTLRGTLAQVSDELTRAKEQAAPRAADSNPQTELSQLRAQVATNETQIAELTARLNQSRQRADRAVSETENQKMLVAERTQKLHATQAQAAELDELRNQASQDQLALSDLTNQLEQAHARAAQADALEEQSAKQQTRLAESKTQLAAARKKAAPVSRLRKSAQKNRAVSADLKKQIRLSQRQIKTLQAQAQKRETVIVDLTTRLYRIRQEATENLQLVKGIGPTYAARLRTGGIVTLNALANASVAQLQEIIQPRRWQKPALESWIKQAQQLSRKEKLKTK